MYSYIYYHDTLVICSSVKAYSAAVLSDCLAVCVYTLSYYVAKYSVSLLVAPTQSQACCRKSVIG